MSHIFTFKGIRFSDINLKRFEPLHQNYPVPQNYLSLQNGLNKIPLLFTYR